MKKLLLGSTALVAGGLMAAPAMAADPIKMGVGGYYTFYAAGGHMDSIYNLTTGASMQFRGFNFIQEGEIHFIGQTKLDNGTTVGLTVEFEANHSTAIAAPIDEAFLFAFGSWGRIEMGSRDAASYRMYYGSPSALIGWGWFQHNHQWSPIAGLNKAYRGGIATTNTPNWQDVNRINYFTPRFAGFQLGVGYAPKLPTGPGAGPGGGFNGCGFAGPINAAFCTTNDYTHQDAFDIGINYLNKFGDFTVALYAAYAYAHFVPGFPGNAAAANIATGANTTNWVMWVAGAQFGIAGFTIGGAFGWDNNALGRNWYTGVDNDTRFYTAAIMYETGPWQVSAGWAGFRNTNGNGTAPVGALPFGGGPGITAAGSSVAAFGQNIATGALAFGAETVDKFEVGANYALAPGVKMVGGFMYYDLQAPGTNPAARHKSWVFLLGMDFRF
jgi:outer membrane protein OmpU